MTQMIFEMSDEAKARIDQAFQKQHGKLVKEAIIDFVRDTVYESEKEEATTAAEALVVVDKDLIT